MNTRSYRIRILRDGTEFEAEGDKAFVLDMMKRFGPDSAQQDTPTAKPSGGKHPVPPKPLAAGAGKSVSIREFMQKLGARKHTDITLAFGYYLEKNRGVDSFAPADLNNCYYEAKLEPSNTSQMIIQNIKRGFMMESKKPGEKGRNRYTLTRSGEEHVETQLTRVVA